MLVMLCTDNKIHMILLVLMSCTSVHIMAATHLAVDLKKGEDQISYEADRGLNNVQLCISLCKVVLQLKIISVCMYV